MQLKVVSDTERLSIRTIEAQVGMRLANGYKVIKVHSKSVVAECNGHTDKFLAPESIFYTEALRWGFIHPTVDAQAENSAALVRKFRHGEAAHQQYVEYGYAPALSDRIQEAGYSFAKQVEAHRQIAIAQERESWSKAIQHPSVNTEREKDIHQYVTALDRGDMEGIGIVLKAAEKDPELERIIREVNLAYQEEEFLTGNMNTNNQSDEINFDWLFDESILTPKPRTAEEFLLECGGVCEAQKAEEEFSVRELLECAKTRVFGESLYWVADWMSEDED